MESKSELKRARISDGLVKQNIVLMSGIATASVAAASKSLESSLVLALGFTLIAFFSVCLCRFIPKKIVYTIRVIIYAVIAGIVYIPVHLLLTLVFGETAVLNVGVFLPVFIVNPLILTKTETRFCLRPFPGMMKELIGYILGFDLVCVFIGLARDVAVNGRIGYYRFNAGFQIPALENTFGGLIMVGVLAGMFRALYNRRKRRLEEKAEKERELKKVLENL